MRELKKVVIENRYENGNIGNGILNNKGMYF